MKEKRKMIEAVAVGGGSLGKNAPVVFRLLSQDSGKSTGEKREEEVQSLRIEKSRLIKRQDVVQKGDSDVLASNVDSSCLFRAGAWPRRVGGARKK